MKKTETKAEVIEAKKPKEPKVIYHVSPADEPKQAAIEEPKEIIYHVSN